MAFCGNCGAQTEGNQRFCGSCGADQTAHAAAPAAAPIAAPAPVPAAPIPPAAAAPNPLPPPLYAVPPAVAPPVPAPPSYAVPVAPPPLPNIAPMPAPPPQYGTPAPQPAPYAPSPFPQAMPGQPPIIMGAPPTAGAQNKKTMWIVAGLVAVGVFYYIGTHDNKTTTPGTQPTTQPQQQPQQQPQAPANPGQQPPNQGGGGGDTSQLVQMQSFTGQIGEANGQVQVSNGKWTNNATVSIQSSNLQCVQTGNGDQPLTQTNTTLTGPNGPLAPNTSTTFNPFLGGAVVQGATAAQCKITAVVPSGQ